MIVTGYFFQFLAYFRLKLQKISMIDGKSIHFSIAHVKGLIFVQEKLIQNHSANKKGSVTQIFELSNFRENV